MSDLSIHDGQHIFYGAVIGLSVWYWAWFYVTAPVQEETIAVRFVEKSSLNSVNGRKKGPVNKEADGAAPMSVVGSINSVRTATAVLAVEEKKGVLMEMETKLMLSKLNLLRR
uniref:Transmembrane protein n=1 Tax=Rhabditophanes sp. KR3021 TaxID=114890 RepID=A0AC35UFI1_9BILA